MKLAFNDAAIIIERVNVHINVVLLAHALHWPDAQLI